MSEAQIQGNPQQTINVESLTGKVSFQIIITLLGGTLLICAMLAKLFLDTPGGEISGMIGGVATILLAAPLVAGAVRDLTKGQAHMKELVALAVLAAFVMGWYIEAGAIAFFMIISVLIESRTALGAQASIESLIKITPTRAVKVNGDSETEVEVKNLSPGDIVRVRPGDNIPADGKVVKGLSTVNQANITGESLPADKTEDDEVFGGTINLTGVMDIEVTKAGEDTTLGRVKDLIAEAEQTRIPLQRMVDRYAQWYTPTILMIVFIVWFFVSRGGATQDAAERAIAMLVIAAPIPLILATPTAMVAALSAAARLGVLVKSVINLEAARNLTSMIFDKTGTLTTGQLEVTRLSPAEGIEGADLLKIAATVEQNSRHPVARAVVKVAKQANLKLLDAYDFEEVAGKGVKTKIDNKQIMIGRGNWVSEEINKDATDAQNVADIKNKIEKILSSKEATGLSTLFVIKENKLLGWLGLADNTRDEAADSMDALREIGLKRLIIVTGDRQSVAERIAGQLHTEYTAEVLPHQKLEIVDELKSRGHNVAMIGDGVNDAPALAAGDISIAMGAAGSDVAIHSASIVINNNNLNRIPFLIRLSKWTSSVIRQNLIIGGGFIVIFISLAAAGIINPVWAAILQVISSLLVVFNSARLVRCGEDIEHAEAQMLEAKTKKINDKATAK